MTDLLMVWKDSQGRERTTLPSYLLNVPPFSLIREAVAPWVRDLLQLKILTFLEKNRTRTYTASWIYHGIPEAEGWGDLCNQATQDLVNEDKILELGNHRFAHISWVSKYAAAKEKAAAAIQDDPPLLPRDKGEAE